MEGQAEGGESAAGPATPPCREGLPARPVPRVPGLQLAVEHQGRKEGFLQGSSTVWPQDAPPSPPQVAMPTTKPQVLI